MTNAESTLEVLEDLRGRWAEKFSGDVVRHEAILQRACPEAGDPFAGDARLAALARQLAELQTLILAMEQATVPTFRNRSNRQPRSGPTAELTTPFSTFIAFVMENRLVEAGQELARVLPMPVERLMSATDFFARTVHGSPRLGDQLEAMCHELDTLHDPDAAKILIRTLGFQAVEAQFAVDTLRRIIHTQPVNGTTRSNDTYSTKSQVRSTTRAETVAVI